MIEELAALKRMTAKNKSCVNFTNVVIFFYHISLQHYLTVYENKSQKCTFSFIKIHWQSCITCKLAPYCKMTQNPNSVSWHQNMFTANQFQQKYIK